MKWRKLMAVLFASLIAGAFTGPALADPLHPNAKCNSGNGNGSETTPATDCDPGNSAGNNNGGD
jgi:hypothetical protein